MYMHTLLEKDEGKMNPPAADKSEGGRQARIDLRFRILEFGFTIKDANTELDSRSQPGMTFLYIGMAVLSLNAICFLSFRYALCSLHYAAYPLLLTFPFFSTLASA